jgi:hypothetical protein
MEFRNFFGPVTAATAAGAPQMGSVFAGLPSPTLDPSQAFPRYPAPRSLPAGEMPRRANDRLLQIRLCGCGA